MDHAYAAADLVHLPSGGGTIAELPLSVCRRSSFRIHMRPTIIRRTMRRPRLRGGRGRRCATATRVPTGWRRLSSKCSVTASGWPDGPAARSLRGHEPRTRCSMAWNWPRRPEKQARVSMEWSGAPCPRHRAEGFIGSHGSRASPPAPAPKSPFVTTSHMPRPGNLAGQQDDVDIQPGRT